VPGLRFSRTTRGSSITGADDESLPPPDPQPADPSSAIATSARTTRAGRRPRVRGSLRELAVALDVSTPMLTTLPLGRIELGLGDEA
jgi:hypothetical protein